MASTSVDEFLLNFDLNQLSNQENVQTLEQKYQKLRKSTSWLKSKIITTDFAIQKYQAKKDDYDRALKAHSVTKEELRKVCINYNDASEKCTTIENENKILLANQNLFKQQVLELENKYGALVSHTNQLQMLVKQLENERDSLKVEKELDNFNQKDRNQEITALKKEKEAMFNDIVSLKDVILGKKKTCIRYIKLLKKYVKDIKVSKESKILCTSEESDNDMDFVDISPNILANLVKNHDATDKVLISCAEQNCTENYSDGEVSVDTGRGSSRANSHDKYLSSPDYVATLETPPKDAIKQIDAANSPITVYPCVSVATSPIIFDDPVPLFEDQCDDYEDSFHDTTDVIDDISLSEDIHVIQEQKRLDESTSTVSDLCLKESNANSPQKKMFINPDESSEFDQGLIIVNQISKYCNKSFGMNYKKKFVDSSTSPVPDSNDLRKLVDIGTNTDIHDESLITGQSDTFQIRTLTTCEKSVCTDTIFTTFVNTCTSPIVYDKCKFVSIGINTDNEMDSESLNEFALSGTNKKISGCLNKNRSNECRDSTVTISTEELRTQEKECLENNSSKSLHFESSNDTEVQNILNVMKLHHDLISPISKTPFDSHCLKLLPEMNNTLTKIWTAISKIYKIPNQSRKLNQNPQNPIEIDEVEEILDADIIDDGRNSEQAIIDRGVKQVVVDNNVIDEINRNEETCGSSRSDNNGSACSNVFSYEDQSSNKSKTTKYTCSNIQSPKTITEENIVTEKGDNNEEVYSNQHHLANYKLNNLSKDDSHNANNTNEIAVTAKSIEENDVQQQHMAKCAEREETCENYVYNSANIENNEICNPTEAPIAHKIIIHGTKTKKKSKLEKLRNKLLPTCKIKKITPLIKKPAKAKNINIIYKDTSASASLNQKIAYDKAVKVMAELRSNQELQNNKKSPKDITRERKLKPGKMESSSSETKMLLTRSRTTRLSKNEEDVAVTAKLEKSSDVEQRSNVMENSPINPKVRKRPADIAVDSLRNSCTRILRSSNVSQTANEEALSIVGDKVAEKQLYKNYDIVHEGQVKSPRYIDNSLDESQNDDQGINIDLSNQKHNLIAHSEDPKSARSNVTIVTSKIIKMKPVIELSKCLADNANVVSIVPGNVGYLDVNKNFNQTNNDAKVTNSQIEGDQCNQSNKSLKDLEINDGVNVTDNNVKSLNSDHCIKQGTRIINTPAGETKKDLMESKDKDSTASLEHDCKLKHNINDKSFENDNDQNCSQTNVEKRLRNAVVQLNPLKKDLTINKNNLVSYTDLDLFTEDKDIEQEIPSAHAKECQSRKENILCAALDRYGVISVKYIAKKVPDNITNIICKKIEESIPNIIASPKAEQKSKMNDLVNMVQNYKTKYILAGLMKYLKDPTRKNELFNKILNGPAPPMTKSEVILLYVIETLNGSLPSGFINRVWNNIEHALFQLNRAPEFDVIESMSHFYAVLCRYFRNKSRLRCFMLDAMYCLQFKAIPLIRQCLDVCPGVLPNAHEHMAKTSLVTCLVYLLHFYKCQDRYNRAQDIRNILNRKYHYRFSEWNETMILEIFRKAIMDLRGTQNDKKMLRVALIILCKRHGAKWCQQNIIQNMLLPIIERKDIPERIKQFCVLMLGPLLKPFPADRKAQCEIVINHLLQMLKQNPSHGMQESIYSSLIFMNKHDPERIVQVLLLWNPEKVSPDFEEILNDYVMEKPLAAWKKLVTRKPSQCS